jgi:oligopeptide/dipeptide ABC transporter ATP-binding protein
MELGDAETVFGPPQHPYTEALLSSIPQVDGGERERIRLHGEIPSHANPPSGCVFHTRCPRYIGDICHQQEPELKEVEPGHFWRCHYSVEELRELQQSAPEDRPAADPAARSREQAAGTRPEPDSAPSGERPVEDEQEPQPETPPVAERPPDVEGTPGARPPGDER